jgi:rhodanese-related sulfurtransferase
MPVKRVSPKEASDLVGQGWKYVDVRSVPEFEAGHPTGAYNIPLMHFAPGRGMTPNPEFADVFAKHFAKGDQLVVGCKTGGRSLRASEMLIGLGFESIVDMRGGFEGERDMVGRTVEMGWKECGLSVAQAPTAGRTWEELKS